MRFVLPAALLVAVPALAACTQNATTSNDEAAGGGGPISVTSTDSSCTVSRDRAPAGPVSFTVDNGGSKVTEFYLYSADGKRIIGEVENIGPGLQGKLTVTAEEGDYLAACKPGMAGAGIRSAFTVTAPPNGSTAPSADQVLVSRAQNRYRTWVQRQSEALVVATRQFLAAYTAGNDARARALYPTARSHYEAIEPVAESFGDLDPKMDAREPDVEPGTTWTGWHRIEKDLWPERDPRYHVLSPAARAAMAANLMKNTKALSQQIGRLTFTTDQIANGSSALMEEVATSKVTGEEEYWSHTDLWDFAANVKGAQAAFEDVRPILAKRDPALEKILTTRFAAINTLLAQHRRSDGYVLYTRLSRAEVKQLADAVNAVSEPLSHLTAAVLP
jgi:iron uptake system component EfeO